jgi:uncharacterized hydrophobic protein (TIGR00341 family)
MALRLIETILPSQYQEEVRNLLRTHGFLELWEERIEKDRLHIELILPTEKTEEILDVLEKRFSATEGFRIILLPVEASIPRLKFEEESKSEKQSQDQGKKAVSKSIRVSREELYSDAEQLTRFSSVFVLLTVFSALVASIGILRNNVVFIIGAMVIAPVLGPNVGLSLATALGDVDLSRKAIRAISVGVLVALVFSVVLGFILSVDPLTPELFSRTQVSFGDLVLALAAGSAAALSFTTGLLSALIGVMVAVALLPPLVATGMLAGSGHWKLAVGSLLLFLANFICVNLSGVITFIVQGIRPLRWWETQKAKKAYRRALLIWTFLLASLAVLIFFSSRR